MRRRIAILILGLALAAGCGDTTFLFVFNSGVILDDPTCQGAGGQFQLRNQTGLVLIVVITSSTQITLTGGRPGTCNDLAANTQVGVDGQQNGDRITARSVAVQ